MIFPALMKRFLRHIVPLKNPVNPCYRQSHYTLNLDENYFDDFVEEGNSIVRSIHYPPITVRTKKRHSR